MDLGIGLTMVLYAGIFFFAGVAWGQLWAERKIRQENKGRMNVSLPVNPEDAAAAMKLLSALIEEVEANREAGA